MVAAPLIFQPVLPTKDLSCWSRELVAQLQGPDPPQADARVRTLNLAALLLHRAGEGDLARLALEHILVEIAAAAIGWERTRGALQTHANWLRLARDDGRDKEAGEEAVEIASALRSRSAVHLGPVRVDSADWSSIINQIPSIEREADDFAIVMRCMNDLRQLRGSRVLKEAAALRSAHGIEGGNLGQEICMRAALIARVKMGSSSKGMCNEPLKEFADEIYCLWGRVIDGAKPRSGAEVGFLADRIFTAAQEHMADAYRGWLQVVQHLESLSQLGHDEPTSAKCHFVQVRIASEHDDAGLYRTLIPLAAADPPGGPPHDHDIAKAARDLFHWCIGSGAR